LATAAASLSLAAAAGRLARGLPAFLAPAPLGRRRALQGATLAPLVGLLMPGRALAEEEPLPPPVEKDVAKTAAKIQGGCDWLYFELKTALKENDADRARSSLGSALQGAYVSPLETDLLIPIEQLLSANLNSEEDGWISAVLEARAGIDEMKEGVGGGEFDTALKAWDKARAGVNRILVDINKRGQKAYFVELDADYDQKRARQYLKKKKEKLAFRNAVGSAALLR